MISVQHRNTTLNLSVLVLMTYTLAGVFQADNVSQKTLWHRHPWGLMWFSRLNTKKRNYWIKE